MISESYNPCMTDILRVTPDELREAGTGWNVEVLDLHATPPSLDSPSPWPTMLASAAVTGAAQAATADLHARIAGTAGTTQVSAASDDASEADAVDAVKEVISDVTKAVRDNT